MAASGLASLLVVALSFLALVHLPRIDGRKKAKRFTFSIAHYNDIHGRLMPSDTSFLLCPNSSAPTYGSCSGGYSRMYTALSQIRASGPTLFLDAGDQFTGTLFSIAYQGAEAYPYQNYMRTTAMTLGNHEFDKGPDVLALYLKNLTFPVATTNVIPAPGSPLYGLLKPGPVVIRLRSKRSVARIGICGWTTTETRVSSSPGPLVTISDPIASVQSCITRLRKRKVKIIVGLGHAGAGFGTADDPTDFDVIANTTGLDLVIGGHSHTFFYNGSRGPAFNASNPTIYDVPAYPSYPYFVGSVPYVQAFWGGRYLGNISVTFSSKGKLTNIQGSPILLGGPAAGTSTIANNAVLDSSIAALYTPLATLTNTVVGNSTVYLDGRRSTVRFNESNLGDLICDAMLWSVNQNPAFGQAYGPTVLALTNGGGIRIDVPAGPITLGQVLTVLPFGNVLQIRQLTGQQLINTLTFSVNSYTVNGFGGFLQLSGLYIAFDNTKPSGSRLLQLGIKSGASCVTAINPSSKYNVVTNDFTGGGGDGYTDLAAATVLLKTGRVLADVVADYIKAFSPVSPAVQGRIVIASTATYTPLPAC